MNTADMVIHVHPDLDRASRRALSRRLESRIGVDCAEFSRQPHSHALLVRYDPDMLRGIELLQAVRQKDPVATMVGL